MRLVFDIGQILFQCFFLWTMVVLVNFTFKNNNDDQINLERKEIKRICRARYFREKRDDSGRMQHLDRIYTYEYVCMYIVYCMYNLISILTGG